MWPGATRAYQVTADGDLFNGAWFVRVRPAADGVPAGAPPVLAAQDRWCPVLRWSRASGPVVWDFEAVAVPEPEPALVSPRGWAAPLAAAAARQADRAKERSALASIPGDRLARLLLKVPHPIERQPVDRRNLFVSLRVTATNTGTLATEARLALECAPPAGPPPYRDADTLVATPWNRCWSSRGERDSLLGFAAGETRGPLLENRWRLAPGERATLRAVLP